MTLPDCMMPDGAEPCVGYAELRDEIEGLRTALTHANNELQNIAIGVGEGCDAQWCAEYATRAVERAALAQSSPDKPSQSGDGIAAGEILDAGTTIIEENDLPGMLGTMDGTRFAYGILWATWGDKDTAAARARKILLGAMTKDDQAQGIAWANRILGR